MGLWKLLSRSDKKPPVTAADPSAAWTGILALEMGSLNFLYLLMCGNSPNVARAFSFCGASAFVAIIFLKLKIVHEPTVTVTGRPRALGGGVPMGRGSQAAQIYSQCRHFL